MNPVVQAQLTAFSETNNGIRLSESEMFEVFSIFSICNGILTDSIDPFDAHLEGHEFGLDGIAIMVQGELCTDTDAVETTLESGKNHSVEFNLFQSKTSEKLDYGDLSKFFDGAYDFFTNKFVNPTPQLTELMDAKIAVYSAALKSNPSLKLFYVTTGSGEASQQISQLIETNKTRFNDLNIFDEVTIHMVGAREIQTGYRSATSSVSEKIEITKPITLPDHPSVQEAFLGLVSAEELVRLATTKIPGSDQRRINKAVFFDNVRDYNPKSEINASILEDLKSGGQESFIFKNNGVTVVAREIRRKGDSFELEDYQIVNGCQTSNILFLAGEDAAGVSIPFRLIGSNDPDFVSTIIVGTNKQNEVKEDQFWALTPFMKDLEEYSRQQSEDQRIFVERRENQYRDASIERTRIIRPSDLLKAVAAIFLYQPHRAARDYRGVRKEFSSKLFQEDHSVVLYHAAAFAAYRFDFAIRNKRIPRDRGIYKFYVLAALGKALAEGKDVFSLKKNKQDKVAADILSICTDEKKFVELIDEVAAVLDEIISEADLDTREKLRDYIRTESVSKVFFEKTPSVKVS